MGREARRSYDLEQVEIVPSRRTRSSQEVSTAWQLDAYPFDDPAGHPPDRRRGVAGERHPDRAARRAGRAQRRGAVGAARRRRGRARPGRRAAAADDPDSAPWRSCRSCTPCRSTPALLAEALKRVREAGVTVAARVSPQRARELAPDLLAAGVEILVVQGTIISAEHVSAASRSTSRTSSPRSTCRWSRRGCGDYRTAMHLMRTGAAGVIVGYGQSARHHHRRGARHRGADGHRDRRRRRRPPRLPRRDRRPLRPRHRRRRHRAAPATSPRPSPAARTP